MTDPARSLVSSPTIRDDSPAAADDWAEVVLVKGPVVVTFDSGTLHNGVETAVGPAAVEVIAADATRKSTLVQNVGTANIRVGVIGVTATTGVRLIPDAIIVFDEPYEPTQALYAIAEGVNPSIAFAMAVT